MSRSPETRRILACRRESLTSTAAEWDDLADAIGCPPFLRPGWFEAWQRSYGDVVEVLTMRRGAQLVGVLPVCLTSRGLRFPTNAETPFFAPITTNEDARRSLTAAALVLSGHHMDLSCLRAENEGLLEDLRLHARQRGLRHLTTPCRESAYVDTAGTWADYLAAMSKKRRHEIRRQRRRIRAAGRTEARVYDGAEGLDSLLEDGFRIEASGWKESYGTSLASQPRQRRFYEQLAHWAAESGWLRLVFLELDGQRIAFDFGLEFDRTRWVMKIGFDPEYQRLSPGSVMRAFEIERAFQDETRRYELLGAARGTRNDWKLRWTSQQHDLVRVQVFDRSLSGRLLWARESRWKPLASAVGDRARKSMDPETRKKLNRAMAPLKRARGR